MSNHRSSYYNKLHSSQPFDSLQNHQLEIGHNMDTTLRLDTLQSATCFDINTKGLKRKWSGESDSSEDGFSLALHLGHSPSSSDDSRMSSATLCTLSSTKETDEEVSMDLDLNFKLHLGSNENSPSPKKHFVDGEKAVEAITISDLELSLSTGPPASVITTASVISNQYTNNLEGDYINLASSDGYGPSQWKSVYSALSYPRLAHMVHDKLSCGPILTEAEPTPSIENLSSKEALAMPTVSAASVLSYASNQCNARICHFQGCGKCARGNSGLCIAHGGGRRCQKDGCSKGAEGRTIYCKTHGGGRRCEFLGCTKSAEGRTDFCIAHGGGRRCSHEDCTRASRGKSGLCIRHGGGKRCQMESCTKSAEGCSGFCISHGGGRRCHFPSCSKGAQGSTSFCKAHGGGKRCTVAGCNKGAEGSTPFCKGHGGGKRCTFQGGSACSKSVHGGTLFCVAHGGGKRCAIQECTKSARGRTDFCVRHGGGKRCKSQGCKKSAQGSTDFCKAHGGGKRCLWGRSGSEFGTGESPCDRFVRGKSGLCVAHSALVEDLQVHGGGSVGGDAGGIGVVSGLDDTYTEFNNPAENSIGGHGIVNGGIHRSSTALALSEGRVHGGSLLAMLANSMS